MANIWTADSIITADSQQSTADGLIGNAVPNAIGLSYDQAVAILLAKTSFLSAGVTPVPPNDAGDGGSSADLAVEIGTTGTPVINVATKVPYSSRTRRKRVTARGQIERVQPEGIGGANGKVYVV